MTQSQQQQLLLQLLLQQMGTTGELGTTTLALYSQGPGVGLAASC